MCPEAHSFGLRFERMFTALANYSQKNPDSALLALVQLSASEVRFYSATHAMLVAVIGMMVARETLRWPLPHVHTLGRAALTMNISMTQLQDDLAQQRSPLSTEQAKDIDHHSARSITLLQQLGVSDALWLEAIKYHHFRDPGKLGEKSISRQMARLIQRADILGARIAPRVGAPRCRSPRPCRPATTTKPNPSMKPVLPWSRRWASTRPAPGCNWPAAKAASSCGAASMLATPGCRCSSTARACPAIPCHAIPAQPAYKITGPVAHREHPCLQHQELDACWPCKPPPVFFDSLGRRLPTLPTFIASMFRFFAVGPG